MQYHHFSLLIAFLVAISCEIDKSTSRQETNFSFKQVSRGPGSNWKSRVWGSGCRISIPLQYSSSKKYQGKHQTSDAETELFVRPSVSWPWYIFSDAAGKKNWKKETNCNQQCCENVYGFDQKGAWSFYVWHLHECKWRCHPYVCNWWHWKYEGWNTGSQRYRKVHCSSW